jgi:IS30 family transposase
LTFEQREEIAVLKAEKKSDAEIARAVGCHRSTIGRELKNGSTTFPDRKPKYRASVAQAAAEQRAKRLKPGKLATSDRLRAEVQTRLEAEHSPEQIAARLKMDFPDDAEMRVSPETIYKAIYVQGRGELQRDLHNGCERGGRCANHAGPPASAAARSRTWSASPTGHPRPTSEPYPATGRAT